MSEIVVGIDGSEESRDALRWAVDEAARRGATVIAVSSWESSAHAGAITRLPPDDDATVAKRALDEELRPFGSSLVEISGETIEGRSTKVLTERSANSELLVLGSGRRVGVPPGSVIRHCITYAQCTVVVVRARPTVEAN